MACSVFSPHWLQPADWLLPDGVNAITAVLNSPTTLTLLQCADWRYEHIFVLTATQPAQMLATFGLLFVPCYWSERLRASPESPCAECGWINTCITAQMRARWQLQVHEEG